MVAPQGVLPRSHGRLHVHVGVGGGGPAGAGGGRRAQVGRAGTRVLLHAPKAGLKWPSSSRAAGCSNSAQRYPGIPGEASRILRVRQTGTVLTLLWWCTTHNMKTLRSTGKGRARVTRSQSERATQIPCTVFEIVGLLTNRWTHDCEIALYIFRDRASILRHLLDKSPTISKTVQGICLARSEWLCVTRARPFPVLRNVFSLWVMHLQYNLSTCLAHT